MTDERDTTSHISIPARSVPVDSENAPGAGTVQSSLSLRQTEAEALSRYENPYDKRNQPASDVVAEHRERGEELCRHCWIFKPVAEFSRDERNTGRQKCHSYCLECMAGRDHHKRMARLSQERRAQVRYEYRKRKAKQRTQKRK